jgi:hypothetical protein
MKLMSVEFLEDGKEKLVANFYDRETKKSKSVKFGVKDSFTYIEGASKKIRDAYRARHARDIINPDPTTKGNLSYYLTWGPTQMLGENISLYRKKFNV